MYKVLVIEDESIIRKGLVYNFPWEYYNCSVVGEADNGEDGLSMINSMQPDIVLLDISIPILDGLQMLEQVEGKKNLSIIIISGSSRFDYAKKAIEFGVVRYLSKPIERNELIAALQEAIVKQEQIHTLKNNSQSIDALAKQFKSESLYIETKNEVVQSMLNYVIHNYGTKIQMKDLIRLLNYSETFLNSSFKNTVGVTFNQYVMKYRVHKAIEMLANDPRISVKDLASRCGFSDYKYFNQVFKKFTNYSPKEFIQMLTNSYGK